MSLNFHFISAFSFHFLVHSILFFHHKWQPRTCFRFFVFGKIRLLLLLNFVFHSGKLCWFTCTFYLVLYWRSIGSQRKEKTNTFNLNENETDFTYLASVLSIICLECLLPELNWTKLNRTEPNLNGLIRCNILKTERNYWAQKSRMTFVSRQIQTRLIIKIRETNARNSIEKRTKTNDSKWKMKMTTETKKMKRKFNFELNWFGFYFSPFENCSLTASASLLFFSRFCFPFYIFV